MNLMRAVRSSSVVVVASAIALAIGCSTGSADSEGIGSSSARIIGGVADTTDVWAVGIDIGGAGVCSGTLIAPNLVLTARHCVSKTPNALDCDPDGGLATNKILGNYPASSFRVTTGNQVGASPQWSAKAVYYIDDPKANQVCGYDLALIELNKNSSGFPAKWVPPSLVAPKKSYYTAIGYGCQNPEKAGGGGCAPLGTRMKLDAANVVYISPQEFYLNGRVCGGDSGGPVWSKDLNVVFGALSRGDGPTSTSEGCTMGLYTRTDAHLAWLQKYGKIAATNGGYAPLEWMSASPPAPDAGPPPPVTLGLGEPCASPADCKSGVCVDFGEKLCSKVCDAKTPCPTGFECNGGYCYPAGSMPDAGPPPVEEDAATDDAGVTPAAEETIKAGSCNVGNSFPPPKPQPWIVAGLAGVAAVIARRRRR